ncbi:hypothetical protein VPH35_073471 [Triticum aestivum]
MKDPITAPTSITNGRERWMVRGRGTCPITGGSMQLTDLIPNNAMRRMIQDWCVVDRAKQVPVAEAAAAQVLAAARRGNAAACGLTGEPMEGTSTAALDALGTILAALTVFFPLDDEARRCIASQASLNSQDPRLGALPRDRMAAHFTKLGAVLVVVELLVVMDTNKGTSEKALAVLDNVLCGDTSLESARAHTLVVPVLVNALAPLLCHGHRSAPGVLQQRDQASGQRAAQAVEWFQGQCRVHRDGGLQGAQ